MKFLAGFVTAILLLAVGVIAVVYSGTYNVAASEPHTGLGTWLLNTTMQRSVSARAGTIATPRQLTAEDARGGFEVFDTKCSPCHGAPGKDRGDIAKGLQPQPPNLEQASQRWTSSELFWIAKHGIRMTGMPAFGQSHSDEEIWKVVALIQRLSGMTRDQYKRMERDSAGPSHERRPTKDRDGK